VRYERSDSFKADYKRLSEDEKQRFRDAVRDFNAACDEAVASRSRPKWPAHLRVKAVQAAPGVWEMTWSFAGPDGRATWEWTTVTDRAGVEHPAVRWRRIGDHKILKRP
jgi:hypothetical protein